MPSEVEKTFERLEKCVKDEFQREQRLIDEAKELFSWLEANRQLDEVSNIDELLVLLRRRNCWRQDNFHVFKMFKKLINKKEYEDLIEKLEHLQKENIDKAIKNQYAERRRCQNLNNKSVKVPQQETVDSYLANGSAKVPQEETVAPIERRNEIFTIISRGLNLNEARALARNLRIEENRITDIFMMYGASSCMVVLNTFEERSNNREKLLRALRRMGRSDLVQKIEDLFKD